MLGVDLYRYQTVEDYQTLARAAGYAWVKASDGGAPAQVRADAQVRGCQAAGVPVGLYHYAQFDPSPERQAAVLRSEVERLGAADLPPALDLEAPFGPGSRALDFARRFLSELLGYYPRVTLYSSASMLGYLHPDQWGISDRLLIWVAAYGSNVPAYDPVKSPAAVRRYYTGRYDVHQFTSNATVPGVRGRTDANWALTDPRMEATNMVEWNTRYKFGRTGLETEFGNWIGETNDAAGRAATTAARIEVKLDTLGDALSDDEANVLAAVREVNSGAFTDDQVAALAAAINAGTPDGVTVDKLAEALRAAADKLGQHQEG